MLARCCCGTCEVIVDADPVLSGICHCNDCKRRTGSAFGLSVYFRKHQVTIQRDETEVYQLDSALGRQERHFCRHCGTTVYWVVEYFSGLIGVAGGCFAEVQLPEPTFNAMADLQCHWLSVAPDKPLTKAMVEDIANHS